MEETLRQYQELLQSEEMNMGGRVGLGQGGDPMDMATLIKLLNIELGSGRPNTGPVADSKSMRDAGFRTVKKANGGLMELAGSAGDRPTMEDADEHSFRLFNKPYLELEPFELEEFDEEMARLRSKFMADGGSVPQTESIPQGMQLDGRGGGFIPMGAKEKHDDVPAMLAKNEFVMTSDAVKAAGGGSVNKGAQVMYDLMNSLESKV